MGDENHSFNTSKYIINREKQNLLFRLHFIYCPSRSPSQPGLVALEISHQAFYHLSMNKPWVPNPWHSQRKRAYTSSKHTCGYSSHADLNATDIKTTKKGLISLLNANFSLNLHKKEAILNCMHIQYISACFNT